MIPEKDWHAQLLRITQGAGEIVRPIFHGGLMRQYAKADGFATNADLESEKYLIKELTELFPEASILAEESGEYGVSEYQWVIDPLDGTTNFAHGIPYYCISVALTHNNVPQVGAIFAPETQDFFYAELGKQASCNGLPIFVSLERQAAKTLVALGLPYDGQQRLPLITAANSIASRTLGIRHSGAAALDCAYVASGRLDGLFFTNLKWWDVAAGILIMQQAGAQVSAIGGGPVRPERVSCIAGNEGVYRMLANALKDGNFS